MFLTSLSNFQRVSCVIGAAIGRDVRVMSKDADSDRMRCARVASRRARALAPRSRPRLYEWFPRDFGASTSRATRSSPRPGRTWRDAMCCLRGRMSYLTSRNSVRCHETLCNLLEINTTSRLFITEMVTRSALLVCGPARPAPGRPRRTIFYFRTTPYVIAKRACKRMSPKIQSHPTC